MQVSTSFTVEYGGGLKYFLLGKVANFFFTDNIALRADVRHVIPFNDRYNNLLCTFGIEFSFSAGGKEKITPREPTAQSEEVAPQAEAPAPVAEVAVAPPATVNLVQVDNTQTETKSTTQEEIKDLAIKWLNSWRTGDMETYRSCYVS